MMFSAFLQKLVMRPDREDRKGREKKEREKVNGNTKQCGDAEQSAFVRWGELRRDLRYAPGGVV